MKLFCMSHFLGKPIWNYTQYKFVLTNPKSYIQDQLASLDSLQKVCNLHLEVYSLDNTQYIFQYLYWSTYIRWRQEYIDYHY